MGQEKRRKFFAVDFSQQFFKELLIFGFCTIKKQTNITVLLPLLPQLLWL